MRIILGPVAVADRKVIGRLVCELIQWAMYFARGGAAKIARIGICRPDRKAANDRMASANNSLERARLGDNAIAEKVASMSAASGKKRNW